MEKVGVLLHFSLAGGDLNLKVLLLHASCSTHQTSYFKVLERGKEWGGAAMVSVEDSGDLSSRSPKSVAWGDYH